MKESISNRIVITLVLLAMVISIIGTIIVTSAYDQMMETSSSKPQSGTGHISLNVGPNTGGQVKLDVVENSDSIQKD